MLVLQFAGGQWVFKEAHQGPVPQEWESGAADFPYTIGVELTGVWKGYRERTDKDFSTGNYRKVITRLYLKKDRVMRDLFSVPYTDLRLDGHCIEVSSDPFKNIKDFKTWFLAVRSVMRERGVLPHHPETVCGGGHIHVGVSNEELRERIYKDVCSRYYLPWVFSQPDEDGSCDNKIARFTGRRRKLKVKELSKDNKDYSVRLTNFGTVEFRFFEAPLDWNEQFDHLRFVLRYIQLMEQEATKGINRPLYSISFEKLQKVPSKVAIADFKHLLKQLNLPYQDYEKYVKRNLLPRWKLGRSRR